MLNFNQWFIENESRFFWITNDFDNLTQAEEDYLIPLYSRYMKDFHEKNK